MRDALKRAVAITLGLWLIIGVGQASAWQFSVQGDWNWEFKLYSQMGDNGFFGPSKRIASTGTAYNWGAANSWLGNEILSGDLLVSGADASASTMYMTLKPEFRLNEAVRVRGSYYIGSWQNSPYGTIYGYGGYGLGSFAAPEYFTNSFPGKQSTFSPGYWNLLWASAQTPWGTVVLGKRPFSFGCGLILDGEDNTTYEGLLVVAPYGPFRIGGAWMPWTQGSTDYITADKNGVQDLRVGGFFTYDNGPLSMGAITEYMRWHLGPESQFYLQTGQRAHPGLAYYVPGDRILQYATAFAKFNNGRFFFNAEAAVVKIIARNQRNLVNQDNTNLGEQNWNFSRFAPTYTDHGRCMVEMGGYSGPAKLTLLWAYVQGGEDRRAGIFIDRQADTRALSLFSNYSVFRPYSILLAWDYGSGNQSYTSQPNLIGSDNGYMTDVNVYAGRLDYAVAANLNVYGSFLWAERLSKGYGWGYLAPQFVIAGSGYRFSVQYGANRVALNPYGQQYNGAPAIPDNALGWEVNGGCDWQLLEGYTISFAFGYWNPGKWFNYACVDRSVLSHNPVPFNEVLFGVNPDRTIDPVFGMDVLLKAEF